VGITKASPFMPLLFRPSPESKFTSPTEKLPLKPFADNFPLQAHNGNNKGRTPKTPLLNRQIRAAKCAKSAQKRT